MLHRTVAAKRAYLNPERDPEQARQETLAAAKRAMKVVHPSAVTMYDALRQDDEGWLIREYVPSRNMAEFLYEYGTLTPEPAGYLGAALDAALASAHKSGSVRGPVKPCTDVLVDN